MTTQKLISREEALFPRVLLSLFDIRSGEGRPIGLLLAYAFLLGIPGIVTETTAYALFLAEFDASALPYIYIGFAVVTTTLGFIYTKLQEQLSFSRFLTTSLVVLLASLVLFRLLPEFVEARWPVVALAIWSEAIWVLVSLALWTLAGRLLNVRQSKRLFGLIGASFTLSEITSGFSVPGLVGLMGTTNLLLVAAAGVMGALIIQLYMSRVLADQLADSDEAVTESQEPESRSTLSGLIRNRYILLIFALAALSFMSYYVLDNIFYAQAEIRYNAAGELASFIGVFFALVGLLDMVLGTMISGRLLSRFGLQSGLLAMPTLIAISAAGAAVTGTIFDGSVWLFWPVIITKLVNEATKGPINGASARILYQPLPIERRLQAQTVVESIVEPLAGGLAGVMLLLFTSVLAVGTVQLIYILLLFLAVWIAVVIVLNRVYPVVLRQALAKRSLDGGPLALADRSSIAILQQSLDSPQIGVVLYALDRLEALGPSEYMTGLEKLMHHPERVVRLDVLTRLERLGLKETIPLVQQQLRYEGSRPVQAASLRVLATLGGSAVFDQVSPFLTHSDPYFRQEALVGLLRSGEIEGLLLAGEPLLASVKSTQPEERVFAAQTLGEGGIAGFYRPLLTLLQDEQPTVRRAAVIAAGKLRHPRLWPAVVECLEWPAIRSTAVTALSAGGESVIPALKEALAQQGQEREVLMRLARICGRIGGGEAVTLLEENLDFPDVQVRSQILLALNRCSYQARTESRARVEQALRAEVAQAAWSQACLADLGEAEAVLLLKTALDYELTQQRARLFLWLSFLYDLDLIREVQTNLDGASVEKRAYAIEIIQVRFDSASRSLLLPLLDQFAPAERLRQLKALFPQSSQTCQERLREIITASAAWSMPWTKLCALYAIEQLEAVELADDVAVLLTRLDPILCEAAARSLTRLQRVDKYFNAEPMGDLVMLTMVEKVMLLKRTDFFAETPEETLVEVAALLEPLTILAGATLLDKGQAGSSFYILIDGQVRVHDGERVLANLGEGDVLGELTLLDPAPRSNSVTAVTDTRLFRLDQEPFHELLDDHSEIAWKLLQLLARRLRRSQGQSKAERARDDLLGGLKEKLVQKG